MEFASQSNPTMITASSNSFAPSRYPFINTLNTSDIPQFVTITFDDSIDSYGVSLYQQYLLPIRSTTRSPSCTATPVRFTCFVSFDASECEAIQSLLDTNAVEFGHHTENHTRLPSAQDIRGAMDSLLQCGVPVSRLGGFRAPFLDYNQATFDNLYANQVLYDATIIPRDDDTSQYGRENQWPFTLDQGFTRSSVQCGNTGTCAQPNKSYTGLWEIPLYRWYYPNETYFEVAMDYQLFQANVQQNFERRYYGNRAPFGIYLHADWLQENGVALQTWIQQTLDAYDDVYFVTNMELIQWMKNPVSKQVYATKLCNTSSTVDTVEEMKDGESIKKQQQNTPRLSPPKLRSLQRDQLLQTRSNTTDHVLRSRIRVRTTAIPLGIFSTIDTPWLVCLAVIFVVVVVVVLIRATRMRQKRNEGRT